MATARKIHRSPMPPPLRLTLPPSEPPAAIADLTSAQLNALHQVYQLILSHSRTDGAK